MTAIIRQAGLATVLSLLASSATAQDAGAQAGQLLFNNTCRTCHTTQEGDNRLGPNLHGIVGRKAGSLPNTCMAAKVMVTGQAVPFSPWFHR